MDCRMHALSVCVKVYVCKSAYVWKTSDLFLGVVYGRISSEVHAVIDVDTLSP